MKKLLVMVGVVAALAGVWRWHAGSQQVEATDGGGNKLLSIACGSITSRAASARW